MLNMTIKMYLMKWMKWIWNNFKDYKYSKSFLWYKYTVCVRNIYEDNKFKVYLDAKIRIEENMF